jgi:hypothetical protein
MLPFAGSGWKPSTGSCTCGRAHLMHFAYFHPD